MSAAASCISAAPNVIEELEGALFVLVKDGGNGIFFHFPAGVHRASR
ncbi:hypothetical protein ACFYXF_11645 [Streptomyces sp. NPDC002680]